MQVGVFFPAVEYVCLVTTDIDTVGSVVAALETNRIEDWVR